MDLILFTGNSIKNKPLLDELTKTTSDLFENIYAHYYKHWENGSEFINVDEELNDVMENVAKLRRYVIIAKSAGCLLAMKGIYNGQLSPEKIIFMGVPVNWTAPESAKATGWLSHLKKIDVPTLFVQQENDPYCRFETLESIVSSTSNSNFACLQITGDDHSYSDMQELRHIIEDFMATS